MRAHELGSSPGQARAHSWASLFAENGRQPGRYGQGRQCRLQPWASCPAWVRPQEGGPAALSREALYSGSQELRDLEVSL